jgi:hypothetical protein
MPPTVQSLQTFDSIASCPMRIFMYQLPARFTGSAMAESVSPLTGMPPGLPVLHNTSGEGAIFQTIYDRVASYRCVVNDAAEAEAFFVPFNLGFVLASVPDPNATARMIRHDLYEALVNATPYGVSRTPRHARPLYGQRGTRQSQPRR